jgi:type IX secretion system substrate protein
MKKILLGFLFIVLSSSFLFAQPWGALKQGEMAIGGIGDDRANSVVQTSDYGYVMLGSTTLPVAGAYIVKLDLAGNIQWTKIIDSIEASGIIQTLDGGYAVAGTIETASMLEIMLIKLSSLGNIQWVKTLENGNASYTVLRTYSLLQNSNGSYTILGSSLLTCGTCFCILQMITVDSSGNNEAIGDGSGAWTGWTGANIIKTADRGYLVSGDGAWPFFGPYYGPSSDLIKIDSTGYNAWGKEIEDSVSSYRPAINSIIQAKDLGFVVAGTSEVKDTSNNNDVCIMKLDSKGDVKWSKLIGGPGDDEAMSVVQANDGGYVMAGYTNSFGAGGYDVYIVKVDSVGNLLWTRTIGGTGNDYGETMVKCNDGGYAIAGYTNSYGAGGTDMYFIKLDSVGNMCSPMGSGGSITKKDSAFTFSDTVDVFLSPNSGSGATTLISLNESAGGNGSTRCSVVGVNNVSLPKDIITVSPNPSNGLFQLRINNYELGIKNKIEVYNVLGEQVYSQYSLPNTQYQIDLSSQPSGIYFYRVLSDSKFVGSGKLVKE